MTSVIRRIYENHLHPSRIALLEELEHFEIVAFDEEVVGGVFVHACAWLGDECPFGGEGGESTGFAFAWPEESEVFLRFVFESLAEGFAESVPVNASVCKGFGDDGLEFFEAVFGQRKGGAEFGDGHGKS
jgi:hypothetical protein